MALHYVRACGQTGEEIRRNLEKSPLYAMGDCILIWVNEGDFWLLDPLPVDVAEAHRERAEYERLKAKFEPSSSQ